MFGFLKKKKNEQSVENNFRLVSAVAGKSIPLSEVPDPVFAQKMAGDGIAIDTTGDTIVAPADGELSLVFKTNHAFAMTLSNGIELLVHVGIDTVSLEGEGFERLTEPGQQVKAGTPILPPTPTGIPSALAISPTNVVTVLLLLEMILF